MSQSIAHVAVIVKDYDEAINFYVDSLGFRLVEDTNFPGQDKRWVLVAPPGSTETCLLLVKASGDEQLSRVGNQTGGKVFLFLFTDDFWRDFENYRAKGVRFLGEPRHEPHGTVVVFEDLYGNRWDLLQPHQKI